MSPGGESVDPLLARVRERYAVWNQEGLERFAERFWGENMVWVEAPDFPDAGVHRGREACVRRMAERLEVLGHVQLEVVEAIPHGDRVLLETVIHGRGSASGAAVSLRQYMVAEPRGGPTTLWLEFNDRDAAYAALREGAGVPGPS